MLTRRKLLAAGGAAAAAPLILPYAAMAESPMAAGDVFETEGGEISVHPISHASFVMQTPNQVIYVDPVGGAEAYAGLPEPNLILITHEHGDHYDVPTLEALAKTGVRLLTNPAVFEMLPEGLRGEAAQLANGEETEVGGITIRAIPAYNTTEGRLQYHPEGRDNGYVLGIDGFTVYIAGDTEDIPEMRALEGIDLAFVPMNLPYTMTPEQAASAVAEFAPRYVYPYHYKGQDSAEFARLVEEGGSETEVRMGPWYEGAGSSGG